MTATVRLFSREIVSRLFSTVPVSILGRMTGTRLLTPYYHLVSDHDVPHVKHLYSYKAIKQFEQDVDFLASHYSLIGVSELILHMRTGGPLPDRACFLTFDDGYREMSDVVAPLLLRKGVTATFFVNSAFVDSGQLCYLNKASLIIEWLRTTRSIGLESRVLSILRSGGVVPTDAVCGVRAIRYAQRALLDDIAEAAEIDFGAYAAQHAPYLSSDQIRGLIRNGFAIGGHSVDHPLYSSISMADQITQTLESVTFVRSQFGLNYGVFAFPHTDDGVSSDFFARVAESGLLDVSFGTGGLVDDATSRHVQRFSLERPAATAEKLVAFQYAQRLGRQLRG